jgi:hypothetical protein
LIHKWTKNHEVLGIERVKNGLRELSRMLKIHFGSQVIILVDEYDAALNFALMKFKD